MWFRYGVSEVGYKCSQVMNKLTMIDEIVTVRNNVTVSQLKGITHCMSDIFTFWLLCKFIERMEVKVCKFERASCV